VSAVVSLCSHSFVHDFGLVIDRHDNYRHDLNPTSWAVVLHDMAQDMGLAPSYLPCLRRRRRRRRPR
jgi:hypothetical protein